MSDTSYASGPTVVLVHGAFADAGSWAAVTERLVRAGVPVQAIVNPLRGITADAAYVAGVIRQTPGPVLAVGHSYGGAIITNAVPQTGNVAGQPPHHRAQGVPVPGGTGPRDSDRGDHRTVEVPRGLHRRPAPAPV